MAYTSDREGEAYILSRLRDMEAQCQARERPCFLGFLDDFQRKVSESALKKSPLFHRFFGGYEDAERSYLGLSPREEDLADDQFPIACVEIAFREEDKLTHRDLLGSVMGLSLKRETVGDILVEEGLARVYLASTVKETVLSQLTKVGRAGVSCRQAPLGGTAQRRYQELTGSVSSLRLDCLTALAGNLSRGAAARLISGGLVAVDGQAVLDQARIIRPGEKLSIRGTGKFLFDGEVGTSKKGKSRVRLRKYS